MTKHKTKLVCVGWGVYKPLMPGDIYFPIDGYLWPEDDVQVWRTRQKAIKAYDAFFGTGAYRRSRRQGFVIAKKLWVEVNHGN